MRLYSMLLGVILSCSTEAFAQAQTYRFGVTNLETVMVTAATWNPILAWVEKKTGVALTLHIGTSAKDTQDHLLRGEYDFFVGYPFLQDEPREKLGFSVLLKSRGMTNESAIIVQTQSSYLSLNDLHGQSISMPYGSAFIGYVVPMAELLSRNIVVHPDFVANQESLVMAFKLGLVQAAAVNMRLFEKAMFNQTASYRILWRSDPLLPLPIGAQDSVPIGVAQRVRDALIAMSDDPEGQRILKEINARKSIKIQGWEASNNAEYQPAIDRYRSVVDRNKNNK